LDLGNTFLNLAGTRFSVFLVMEKYLNLYEAARAGSRSIYDRDVLAGYWKWWWEWFGYELAEMERLDREYVGSRNLGEAIGELREIVGACRGAYELHWVREGSTWNKD
jgi:hypothetical protein